MEINKGVRRVHTVRVGIEDRYAAIVQYGIIIILL